MFSIKMITFCKSADCPASQDLLAFQKREAPCKENDFIGIHLKACEFCAAEIEFYERFPQEDEENIVSVEIPLPLFQLAEALLNNRHQDTLLLNKLLANTEPAAAQ